MPLPSIEAARGRLLVALLALAVALIVPSAAQTAEQRTELVSLRTATAKVFENADGTRTAEFHTVPIHFQRSDGSWAAIDTTLVPNGLSGLGWRNAAAGFSLELAPTAREAAMVRLVAGASRISFGAADANQLAAGQVEGDTLTYFEAWPGVDLVYRSLPTGVSERIVLKRAPDGPVTFRFPLELDGLSAREESSGTISLLAPGGDVRFMIPAGWMEDAAVDPRSGDGAFSPDVAHELTQEGGQLVLTVRPDLPWLQDPARVYPVTIDPTFEDNVPGDAHVQKAFPTANYASSDLLKIGTYNGGSDIARSYLRFGVGTLTGKHILNATLSIFENWAWSCNARRADVRRIRGSWSPSTLTWNNKPASSSVIFDSLNVAKGYEPGGCADGRIEFKGLADLVQGWADGTWTAHGLALWARNESDNYGWKKFDSVNAPNNPKLTANYSSPPSVPSLQSPAAGAIVATTVPVLEASSTDPDGHPVEYQFQLAADSGGPAICSSAWLSTGRWPVPESCGLEQGQDYFWHARARDPYQTTAWSGWRSFVVQVPTLRITAPAAGAVVAGTVPVAAEIDPASGQCPSIERVEFLFDDILIEEDFVEPYQISWDTLDPALPAYDGQHALTAKAIPCGAKAAAVTVTVANTVGTKFDAAITSTPVPAESTYEAGSPTQEQQAFDVTVTNESSLTWNASQVSLHYRWLSPDAIPSAVDGPAVSLGADLAPGGSRTLRVVADPPELPAGVDRGQYRLRFDLYDAATPAWFAARGNQPLENPVIVNKKLESEAIGLERYYHYDAEELGAGMQHLVNVANGNSLLRWTPLQAPGRGLSTVLDVTYNSLEKKTESPLGNNFSLAVSSLTRLGLPLDVHPNRADEIAGNARRWIAFTDGDGTTHRFEGNVDGGGTVYWQEPAGVHLFLRDYSPSDPNRKWALTRPDRVTFFFDVDGYPTFVRDRNGNELAFMLATVPPGEDPGGLRKRVTKVTDAGGRAFEVTYYAKSEAKKPQQRGKVKEIRDHTGSALRFDYYEDGNLLRITQVGGTKADGTTPLPDRTFVFTYTDSDGSGPAIADPAARANPDPKTSPQSTRLYSVRGPRGRETIFAYCSATSCGSSQNRWKLQTRTDRAGNATSYGYDIATRVTTVTPPAPGGVSRATRYGYDVDGSVIQVTNPKNETTLLEWSTDRHLRKVTEPTLRFTSYEYNENGYLTAAVDQLGNRTELAYEHFAVKGENGLSDPRDAAAYWKPGRTTAHVSQLVSKTNPKGTATAPADDFRWLFAHDAAGNVTAVTDPEANTTAYSWNTDGTLAASTDPRGVATPADPDDFKTLFQNYDPNGFPTRIVDAEGNVTQLSFDQDGLLLSVQDPNHAFDTGAVPREYQTTFEYDAFHRLGRQSTPKLTPDPDTRGELIWSSFDYDENDNPTVQTQPAYGTAPAAGPATRIAYDAMDRPTLVTGPDTSVDPAGERTVLTYDAAGRVKTVTAPNGVLTATANDHTTEYEYDPLDRIVTEIRYPADGSSAGALRTRYCYDLAGDLTSITPPRGGGAFAGCPANTDFTRKFAYDAAHRLVTETTAVTGEGTGEARHTRTIGYDRNGNVVSRTNERGHVTTFAYDQRDLLTKVTEPFDAIGTRPPEVVTELRYDAVGNLVEEISPRGADARRLDPGSVHYSTEYRYDGLNRLVRVKLPTDLETAQAYVHQAYDPNGNLVAASLPVAQESPGTDPANPLPAIPAEKKTILTYFDPGWIETSDDPGKPPISFDYTAEGWQSSRTPASGTGELWDYYVDGLLKQATDRQGETTGYAYDANGNLTSALDASGSSGARPIVTEVAYDGFERATSVRTRQEGDPDCRLSTFAYDESGNTVARTDDASEPVLAGACTPPASGGWAHTFAYDPADWLLRHLDTGKAGCADDQEVANTFLPTGWEATRVVSRKSPTCTDKKPGWAARQTTSWTYFPNGKLKTLETRKGNSTAAVVEKHTLAYVVNGLYGNGHRTQDSFRLVGPAGSEPCATSDCLATYAYDARDRLTEEVKRGIETRYALDLAGNLTCETRAGTETGFTYTGSQLATQTTGCQAGAPVTREYWYEGEGNLACVTAEPGSGADCLPDDTAAQCPTTGLPPALLADYRYDHLNRLSRFCSWKASPRELEDEASYLYDAFDRPLEETERHDPTGTPKTTTFSYLGLSSLVTGEEQRTDAGALVTARSYSYDAFGHRIALTNAPGPAAPSGTPVATAGTFTYGYDVHGSASLLLDGTGAVTATYGYTPYGQIDPALTSFDRDPADPASPPENLLNPYRYTGKRLDPGSGSYDMGARRFGPDVGRFLQADLYLGALSDLSLSLDPLTQNRYALAAGSPIGYAEVDGHLVIAGAGGGAAPKPKPSGGGGAAGGGSSSGGQSLEACDPTGSLSCTTTPSAEGGFATAKRYLEGLGGRVATVLRPTNPFDADDPCSVAAGSTFLSPTPECNRARLAGLKQIGENLISGDAELMGSATTDLALFALLKGRGAGAKAGPAAKGAGDDVVYRYVSAAEARVAEKAGRIPNVDRFGNPKSVFYSTDRYGSAIEAERALRLGRYNPGGSTASPTYRLTASSRGANWRYAGNVEGGTGIELMTDEALLLLRVERLAP